MSGIEPQQLTANLKLDGSSMQLVLSKSPPRVSRTPSRALAGQAPTSHTIDAENGAPAKPQAPMQVDVTRTSTEVRSAPVTIAKDEISASPPKQTAPPLPAAPRQVCHVSRGGRGVAHQDMNGEEEDPDAYDTKNLDRFLSSAKIPRFHQVQGNRTVGAKPEQELTLNWNGSLSPVQRQSVMESAKLQQHCKSMEKRLLWRPQTAPSQREPDEMQSGASQGLKGAVKGGKLQVPPGVSIRRRPPATARPDPLGDALDLNANLIAYTMCEHPLLAKKRAAERAAAREAASLASQAAAAAAAEQAARKRKSGAPNLSGLRPATAIGRRCAGARRDTVRPASAMARMHAGLPPKDPGEVSEALRLTFENHDSRMRALAQSQKEFALNQPTPDMRGASLVQIFQDETPSKQRRTSASNNRILSGVLDVSSAVQPLGSHSEGRSTELERAQASVTAPRPGDAASTMMPPRINVKNSDELSRTMDARLEAMLTWAEGEPEAASADAKLTDWFSKWLTSYELEQNAFRSAHVYGEVKMSETIHSSALQRLESPNTFRTAIVCDMFGRILPFFGRHKGLLQNIRDELMSAIYPELEGKLETKSVFERTPFFAANAALSKEVSDLKSERTSLWNELTEQENMLIDLRRKVREYREEVQTVKLEAAWQRSKQSRMEADQMALHFGDDNKHELMHQIKKLADENKTQLLIAEAAQGRIREIESEYAMLKMRAVTAESEWKAGSETIEGLRKELALAHARVEQGQGAGVASQIGVGSAHHPTLIEWTNKLLGAPPEKPFLVDLQKDLADCNIYLELVGIIWGSDAAVQKQITISKASESRTEKTFALASIFETVLECKFVDGDQLLSGSEDIHRALLFEIMCSYQNLERVKTLGSDTTSSADTALTAMRRKTVAEFLQSLHALEIKCSEQASVLNEVIGDVIDDEEIQHHAGTKLSAENLQSILSSNDVDSESKEVEQQAERCLQLLHKDGHSLHSVFHYYCKLAERGTEEQHDSKHGSYLSGIETMDLDEFLALITAAKLQLPRLQEACTAAFECTITQIEQTGVGKGPANTHNPAQAHLGLGFVHFEECLVRLAFNLSPQWIVDKESALSKVPDVLEMLNKHIVDNCERLRHIEFGLQVRSDDMAAVWLEYTPDLKEGFKAFCNVDNNSAMSLADFISFVKETKATGARLSVPAIVEIFSCVQVCLCEKGCNMKMSLAFDRLCRLVACVCL